MVTNLLTRSTYEVEYETTHEGIYQDGCEPDYCASTVP